MDFLIRSDLNYTCSPCKCLTRIEPFPLSPNVSTPNISTQLISLRGRLAPRFWPSDTTRCLLPNPATIHHSLLSLSEHRLQIEDAFSGIAQNGITLHEEADIQWYYRNLKRMTIELSSGTFFRPFKPNAKNFCLKFIVFYVRVTTEIFDLVDFSSQDRTCFFLPPGYPKTNNERFLVD
ncbi:hypothetical protein CEXT_545431 [Caerostris extrusa]|uniref:Uncharacterized protein n=1 Tax=Caerostris extrusa TaxID=172846 RepID=A0AAV4QQS5_CAEEX|nr:hypothetical protein CEXT_545431 [Caerostris extrusa]